MRLPKYLLVTLFTLTVVFPFNSANRRTAEEPQLPGSARERRDARNLNLFTFSPLSLFYNGLNQSVTEFVRWDKNRVLTYTLFSLLRTDQRSKYRVVFVRHAESEANAQLLFTGWWNVDLTPKGVEEAKRGGIALKEHGFKFDVAHTSYLRRASKTLDIVLEILNQSKIEKHATWRLNERHLGMLTGLKHDVVARREREWKFLPPPITKDHQHFESIVTDPRYSADPDFVDFPPSESLEMAVQRMIPYWTKVIIPQIKEGKRVLIAAHATLLRGFVFYLDGCKDNELLMKFIIPNGAPFIYEFDEHLEVVVPRKFISLEATDSIIYKNVTNSSLSSMPME